MRTAGIRIVCIAVVAVVGTAPTWAGTTASGDHDAVMASGAAAADPFAPNIEVARVTALRLATERGRAAACQLARQQTLRDGKTLGQRMDADAAVAARVTLACSQARVRHVDWSSDGGAIVRIGLPLEALRLALEPAPPPALDASAPRALRVTVADEALLDCALDVQIESSDGALHSMPIERQPQDGPAVDLSLAAPWKDRLGPIMVTMKDDELSRAIAGGAVLVIVPQGRKDGAR
jgi:hypothetical protein